MFLSFQIFRLARLPLLLLILPASLGFADGPDRAVLHPFRESDASFLAVVRWPAAIDVDAVSAWVGATGGQLASIPDGPANAIVSCLRSDPWLGLDPCDGPWLGLGRSAAAPPAVGPWLWTDATPVVFLAWGEGRPAGSTRLPGHAVMEDDGRWIDVLPGPDAAAAARSAAVRWPASSDADGDGVPEGLEADGIAWILGDPACVRNPADLDGDGRVDASDLAIVLSGWGGAGVADLNGDGIVNAADLAEVLSRWT